MRGFKVGEATHAHESTTERLTRLDARIDNVLEITLQTSTKVIKHGRPSRKNDVLQSRVSANSCAGRRGENERCTAHDEHR